MGRKLLGLVVVFVMLAAAPVLAQTKGGIRGTAVDNDGNPMPGVIVEASGEVLGGANRGTVTAANGVFNFGIMPPGRYRLTASMNGFQTQTVDDVRVSVDAVAPVTFIMVPEAFAGEIKVTSERPLVDTSTATVGAAYDYDFVKDLPTRGNFYDVINNSAGVYAPSEDPQSKYRISAFGSNVQQSAWNVDGVNMTAPEGGYLFFDINPEIVAETQMLGVAAGAEYGSTAGSVYNVVTKSGTNQFHGSAAVYWQDDSLVDPNITIDDTESGEFHINKFYDLSASLGGPIVRDKLWFFGGIQNITRNVTIPGQVPSLTEDSDYERYDLKLSWQINPSHRVDFKGGIDDQYVPWAYDPLINEPGTWLYRVRENNIYTAEYSGVLSDSTFLQVRGGLWRGDNGDLPLGNRDDIATLNYDTSPNTWTGGPYWDWIWEQHHDQADVVLTHFAADFGGDHEFKFGVQYNQGGGTTRTYDTDYLYIWSGYLYKWSVTPYMYGGDTTSWAGFASDTWQISDRFTLDVGVRYDAHDASIPDYPRLDVDSNNTGETIPGVDVFSWRQWSPRVGFAWQVTGDGKTVIRGSAGVYRDGTVSGNWYSPPPEVPPWVTYSYYYGYSSQVERDLDAPLVEPGLEGPSTNEYTLGVEHQIGDNYSVGAQLVMKETKNQIGWHILDDGEYENFQYTDPDTGETFTLYDVIVEPTIQKGNSTGPGANGGDQNYDQEYQGIFLTFKKRYSSGWDMMASYTYSEAKGLTTRPLVSPVGGQGSAFWTNRSESDPNVWLNNYGLLGGDRTHALRVTGNLDLGRNFRLGAMLNFQSGRPEKIARRVNAPTGSSTTFISVPNSDANRMDSQTVLDLSISKRFALGDWGDFNILLQALNVTNENAPTYYNSNILPPGTDYYATDWVYPRRLTLRLKLAF
jgi:outer membrane receptor protein involved in Fe transport